MFLMHNSFVLEKVLEKEQKNKAIYYEMALYHWQGQKDSNPRHLVLETNALPAELYPCITASHLSGDCTFKTEHKLQIFINLFWSSPRSISIGQLNMLPCLHLQPINLIIFKGSYFRRMGNLILRAASRLDAFSVYPFHT